jgi:phosphate acetyltransferase
MSKGLYIATTGPNSGKSVISIGMMEMLLGKAAKVGYFRPIIDDFKAGEMDNHIRTITTHFGLTLNFENAYALTRSEVIRLKNKGKDDEIISKVIHKYKALEADFDFILVEGTDFSGEGTIIEWDINILIAKNLGIPVVLIASNTNQLIGEVTGNLQIALDSFQDNGVQVLMAVANKVRPEHAESVKAALVKNLPSEVQVEVIPMNDVLANPSLREIAQELEGTVLFGENYLNNQAGAYSVGAMQLRNYLTHLKESSLVITPGDRADIILGVLQANISANYPSISGIVLTGGLVPEESILKLIEGLSDIIPVISVKEGTFSITNRIGDIKPKIYAESAEKIKVSKQVFATFISAELLAERLITFKAGGITPRMFQYNLLQRAKLHKKHIVLPEAYDERILTAAMLLTDAGVVNLTLIGEKSKIATRLANLDTPLDLSRVNVLDPVNSEYFEDYAQTLYELRKHKKIDLTMARDLMTDVSYFGTMMVYKGHADGMVSGAIHTTQHTIRPALQFVKTKPGVSVVSSIFFMCLPDRVTVYGDCAINPNPTATELAEIAISSAETSRSFGIEPKIAMLSYSSGTSGAGADVDTVREATAIVKKKRPDLKVEGPIQYDAAVDMKVGKSKMPDSEVAGQASIFIFPDLNTGNNTYKAVQRETGALAIGPILQGLNKPVNDLSRGCTVDDIFNTVIITAIQAHID